MLETRELLNRRSYERFDTHSTSILTLDEKNHCRCILTNFSARGAGIFSRQPLKPRSIVQISFDTPIYFNAPVNRQAKVAWCKQVNEENWECGLDFGLLNTLQTSSSTT